MPLAAYPDLGWFVRAARILPVVAIAAFAGGVLGGFIVFALNGALAPPPRPDLGTNGHANVTVVPTKPVTIVGGTTPDPAATQPPPAVAAPAQSQIQTPPAVPPVATTAQTAPQTTAAQTAPQVEPRPTRWPNALLRGRKVITPSPPPAVTPAPGEGQEQKSAETDHKSSGAAAASADDDRAAARRHAHAARKRDREFSAGARQAGDRAYNRVYDYYDTGDREQRFGFDERDGGRRRVIIRGQRPQWREPAETAQPWSDQFWGGGYYRDGQ
jgi:outer membrane biosynthesis protein TonB